MNDEYGPSVGTAITERKVEELEREVLRLKMAVADLEMKLKRLSTAVYGQINKVDTSPY